MSTLAWLDYSQKDRQRALDFIHTFRERDTRDELGIGVIRDAFSERLFPGTTTVQTRARYFLFVPWLLKKTERYAQREASLPRVTQYLREQEVALMRALEAGGDLEGLFGRSAGATLQRLPSDIYWQGLGTWGIRTFPAGRAQLLRTLVTRRTQTVELSDEDSASGAYPSGYWHAGLPAEPSDLLKRTDFVLIPEEATYLRDRLLARAGDSLLAHLASTGTEKVSCDHTWTHPESESFSLRHKRELRHAAAFSLAMNGAALLYNLMLAEEWAVRGLQKGDELAEDYTARLESWSDSMAEERLAEWDRKDFWRLIGDTNARIGHHTRTFVDSWLDLAVAAPSSVTSSEKARALIRHREVSLKQGLSRFENAHALEQWSGAAGAQRLDFRWGTVQTLVNDIVSGLVGA